MSTRQELRQDIGVLTGQPYFTRFGKVTGVGSAVGTTTTLKDTVLLKEDDNYWRGSYIFFPELGQIREISAFTSSTGTVTWLAPIGSATGTSTKYEIWSTVTPLQVHAALDNGLRKAWPNFFEVGIDTSMVVRMDDNPSYTLPVAAKVRQLAQVYLLVQASVSGTATGGSVSTVVNTSGNFTAADVGKWVSIYEGSGACVGEARQITVANSTTLTVSPDFSSAVTSGMKYRVINVNDPNTQEIMLRGWYTDAIDNPRTLWLGSYMSGYEGNLIKLVYEREYQVMTSDTAETTCPEEYLTNAALTHIYRTKLASAPATEQPVWAGLHEVAAANMNSYLQSHAFQHIPRTLLGHNPHFGLPLGAAATPFKS